MDTKKRGQIIHPHSRPSTAHTKMKEMPAPKTARASTLIPLRVQKCRSSECKKKSRCALYVFADAFSAVMA